MIECWRLHPELMEQKGNREQVVKDNVVNTGKESVPLMVLTSGKVVANIGA